MLVRQVEEGLQEVRCKACGRSLSQQQAERTGRCLYCGGELDGFKSPAQQVDVEVTPDSPTEEAAKTVEISGKKTARVPVALMEGAAPSSWEQPLSFFQQCTAMLQLALLASLVLGYALQHDPLLPPQVIAAGCGLVALISLVGWQVFAFGRELYGTGASGVALVLYLAGGLLGLLNFLNRTLIRLLPSLFRPVGFAASLLLFVPVLGWLAQSHDPLLGCWRLAEASRDGPHWDGSYELSPSLWSGTLAGPGGEAPFDLQIREVDGRRFSARLYTKDDGASQELRGVHDGNHLVFPAEIPAGKRPWWLVLPGMQLVIDAYVIEMELMQGGVRQLALPLEAELTRQQGPAPDTAASPAAERPQLDLETSLAPDLPSPTALRPLIRVGDNNITRGRVFVIRPAGGAKPLAIGAMSLFGPAGGLQRQLDAAALPILASGLINLFDPGKGDMVARAWLNRPMPGARAFRAGQEQQPDATADLVTLRLEPGYNLTPLRLRLDAPSPGAAVWLATPISSEDAPLGGMLAAELLRTWDKGMAIRLTDPIELAELTGAPVVDARGSVVGALVGSMRGEDGEELGVINPAASILKQLPL